MEVLIRKVTLYKLYHRVHVAISQLVTYNLSNQEHFGPLDLSLIN